MLIVLLINLIQIYRVFKSTNMKFLIHCSIGFFIRVIFIAGGAVQDYVSEVSYTDIDYKVFTDGARNILEGNSPYDRHTYRYSPFIAFFLLPNVLVHPLFGKLLFSIIDVSISIILYRILRLDGINKDTCTLCSIFWLYNPLSIVISSRGNADSIAAVFVLWALLKYKQKKFALAGVILAFVIHLRIYPLLFSLPMYICISDTHSNRILQLFYPNKNRCVLVCSCIFMLLIISVPCYLIYGDDYLNESILFHLKRSDIRHNYSVYFYAQYLSVEYKTNWFLKVLMMAPQISLFAIFPFFFSTEEHLPFCKFCLVFILVAYNSVLTCQYFIWYLCLLPLCLPRLSCNINITKAVFIGVEWLIALIVWLLPAYMLEFKFYNTFLWIWLEGLIFFGANIFVLTQLLKNYNTIKVKCK